MFCLILISYALNHLPVGEEERNHLLLTEYRVQQSQDFTLRTLHLFHWSLLSSHLGSKPVISHTNSKRQTKMFACPRREISFFSMKSPLHISAIGWGTIIRTVTVGERAAPWAHWGRSYKLGINPGYCAFGGSPGARSAHDLQKKWINAESLHRFIREAASYLPRQTQVKGTDLLTNKTSTDANKTSPDPKYTERQQIQSLPSLQLTLQH